MSIMKDLQAFSGENALFMGEKLVQLFLLSFVQLQGQVSV